MAADNYMNLNTGLQRVDQAGATDVAEAVTPGIVNEFQSLLQQQLGTGNGLQQPQRPQGLIFADRSASGLTLG